MRKGRADVDAAVAFARVVDVQLAEVDLGFPGHQAELVARHVDSVVVLAAVLDLGQFLALFEPPYAGHAGAVHLALQGEMGVHYDGCVLGC